MICMRISTFNGHTALVSLRGCLVLGDETAVFRNKMQALIENEYRYIAIDLGGIERIDCAGLGALVKCQTLARGVGSKIALQNLPYRVHELLVFTRLVTLFDWSDCDIPRAA